MQSLPLVPSLLCVSSNALILRSIDVQSGLAYGQMTNNLTSQAATMKLGGVPNDIVSNFNPLFIVILIPIMDQLIYPGLRKLGFHFTPIKRITCGFFLASFAMISATVTQHYIYKMGPCGTQANDCEDEAGNPLTVNISVWVQLLPYGLIGFSEIMASVTSLEYAFTKAPTNMRSTVQAIALFMNAVSSALSQALVALADDPLLVVCTNLAPSLPFRRERSS